MTSSKKQIFFILLVINLITFSKSQSESDIVINGEAEPKGLDSNKIYELVDANFERYVKSGEDNLWFVLFYVSTCGHCRRAKEEIKKIVKENTNKAIYFAQIETQTNVMTSIRFNVTLIPYIVLMNKGKMIELDKYPSAYNLKQFISMNLEEREKDFIPIPKPVKFYHVAYAMLKESINGIVELLQDLVNRYELEIQVQKWHLAVIFAAFIGLIIIIELVIFKCCCTEEPMDEKLLEEEFIKRQDEFEKMKSNGNEPERNEANDKNQGDKKEESADETKVGEEDKKEKIEEKEESKKEVSEEKKKDYPKPAAGKKKPNLKKE